MQGIIECTVPVERLVINVEGLATRSQGNRFLQSCLVIYALKRQVLFYEDEMR
jgi:hypothetical protein